VTTIDESIEQLIRIAEDAVYDGDCHQAFKLIHSALLDEPGYPKLHYTLAWIYHYHQVNESLAERHYQLTLYFDPEYADAYRALTDLYFKKKKYEEVIGLMEKAQEVEQLDKDFIYMTLGKVEEKRSNFSDAIHFYRKALMNSVDNEDTKELRQNIKRAKLKRLKTMWRFRKVKERNED
jgi:tetratricopeptide (TPR) repeat protein